VTWRPRKRGGWRPKAKYEGGERGESEMTWHSKLRGGDAGNGRGTKVGRSRRCGTLEDVAEGRLEAGDAKLGKGAKGE